VTKYTTFAKEILQLAQAPLTPTEMVVVGQKIGAFERHGLRGKTPQNTLSNDLRIEARHIDSDFFKVGEGLFYLKSLLLEKRDEFLQKWVDKKGANERTRTISNTEKDKLWI
jgi:hypothetical protein